MEKNSTRRTYSWWWSVSVLAMGVIIGIGMLFVFRMIAWPMALVILSVTLAAGLYPIVQGLERWMNRTLAVIITFVLLLIILSSVVLLIVPRVIDQVTVIAQNLPELAGQWSQLVERWLGRLSSGQVTSRLLEGAGDLGQILLQLPIALFSFVSGLAIVLFLAFYMLMAAPKIENLIVSLVPQHIQGKWSSTMTQMARAMGGYLRGILIDGLLISVAATVGLMWIGVDYALFLGVFSGFLTLIPILGPVIALVVIVLVAFIQSPNHALIALIFLVILQQIEGNILIPYVMRSQTKAPPLLVFIAILLGAAVGGLLGMLVAVPIAAALAVLTEKVVAPAIRRQTGADQT